MTVPSLPPRAPVPQSPGPAGDAPARPDSILILIQLTVVAAICQVITLPPAYSMMREEMVTRAEQMKDSAGIENVEQYATVMTVVAIAVASILILALAAAAVLLVVRGFWWARFLLGWLAAVVTINMIFAFFGHVFGEAAATDPLPVWTMIPRVLGGVAAVGVLLAVMHPDTKKYVDAMAARRTRRRDRNGQGNPRR